MVKRMPDRNFAYFRDDQMLFLVTHASPTVSDEQLGTFQLGIAKQLPGRTISALPRAFSFPASVVDDPERRLGELHDLEIKGESEDLIKRQAELQKLKSLLSSKDGPDELQDIKKLWKKDEVWQELLKEVNRREGLLGEAQALVVDQPRLFDRPFSMLLCDLRTLPSDEEPEPMLTTIQSLRKKLGDGLLKDESLGGMKVEDVSPNWLMSVSSQGGATGGPGALPMSFNPAKDGAPLYEFSQLIEKLKSVGLYDKDEGENVDVAILDTVPCAHDLVLAVKEWPDHRLIQGLLGPSGKLIPYHATYKALQRMASTSLNQHDYPMTNHGLFAAGIVHSIVPKAKIHLIEVLNEFGVGDLASLAEGLALAYNQIHNPNSGRRLVVNCSWMLELPLSDLHCHASEEDGEEYEFEQAIRQYVKEEKDHALTLREICNQLALAGKQVVAAAGNDKLHAKKRREKKLAKLQNSVTSEDINHLIDYLLEYIRGGAPEARYPAAFTSVIGVGALPKGEERDLTHEKYESSNYSNLGDKPSGEAVMTLGGEEGEDNQQRNQGVLGLYLGRSFPRVTGNPIPGKPHKREIVMDEVKEKDNLWAWWAGTSFAAPIVTGAIAAALGTRFQRTQDAFDALKTKDIIKQAGTNADEDVMYVKQGPIPPGP
jgi:hypothetical protein